MQLQNDGAGWTCPGARFPTTPPPSVARESDGSATPKSFERLEPVR